MQKTIKIFLLATLSLVVNYSCISDIDLELKETGGRLVLFSFPVADSVLTIHLSRSVGHSSVDDFERIYDGYIVVNKNGLRIDSFAYPYRETWARRNSYIVNTNDTLEIIGGDSKEGRVVGKTIIPNTVPIVLVDSVRKNGVDTDGKLRQFLNCRIVFNDPEHITNFYQLIISEETWEKDSIQEIYTKIGVNYLKDDAVFYIRDQEGSLLGGIDFMGSFPDYLFNGEKKELMIRLPADYAQKPHPNQKRKLTFTLLSHSKEYFDYMRSRVVAEYNYDLPIVDPIKIHSNVSGGLGLVGGISGSSFSFSFIGENYN